MVLVCVSEGNKYSSQKFHFMFASIECRVSTESYAMLLYKSEIDMLKCRTHIEECR